MTGKPELLAPAGDLSALQAAIGNGADAVYLGAGSFNARSHAVNFAPSELAEAIAYAHLRSVRVYLTLNTLIADDEGDEALNLAIQAYRDGIDAIIVQDVGLVSVLHNLLPDLPLFASTQMTICDRAGLRAAARMGVSRIILPRELSLMEIETLTCEANSLGLETEVFVHGALCVCYSGQCLLSSLIGGRSGNRGSCAQPCRLPWQLTWADKTKSVGMPDQPWPWLSPRDQSLIAYLPQLGQAGVASLKIEGRMRSSAYVGQVVSIYRDFLDQVEGNTVEAANFQLLQAFNRGGAFTDRYISGRRQTDFLSGAYPGSHGVLLGAIIGLEPRRGIMRLLLDDNWPLGQNPSRGDVVSVRRPGQEQEIASAPIGEVSRQGRVLLVKGFHPDALAKFRESDPVYRMTDYSAGQKAVQADRRRTGIDLSIGVAAVADGQDTVILTADVNTISRDESRLTVSLGRPAEAVQPLASDRVAQQLGKTGGTPFRVEGISQSGPVSLTIAGLNALRRDLLQLATDRLVQKLQRHLPDGFTGCWAPTRSSKQNILEPAAGAGQIAAYYYRLPDDPAQIACGANTYYLPILSLSAANATDISKLIRSAEPSSRVFAWLPAAAAGLAGQMLDEILTSLPAWGFDGICAGHAGLDLLAPQLPGQPDSAALMRVADSGANIFNQASLDYYVSHGANAASPSLELPVTRLLPLLQAAAARKIMLELPVYGRLRLMTSAFCPLGQNLPGCRRCHSQALSEIQPDHSELAGLVDRRHQNFPLLTHPRVCSSEIFSHFLLSGATDILQLLPDSTANGTDQYAGSLGARLYFLEEETNERRLLTDLSRRFMQATDAPNRRLRAETLDKAVRQVADRLNCPVGHGHYQQGA